VQSLYSVVGVSAKWFLSFGGISGFGDAWMPRQHPRQQGVTRTLWHSVVLGTRGCQGNTSKTMPLTADLCRRNIVSCIESVIFRKYFLFFHPVPLSLSYHLFHNFYMKNSVRGVLVCGLNVRIS
jgi:hypothetical protein